MKIEPLDEEIRKSLEFISNENEYQVSIDIANRSRDLFALYNKVKQFDNATEILLLMIRYCILVDGLNNPHFYKEDIEKLLNGYKYSKNQDLIKNTIKMFIDKFPDYSNIEDLKRAFNKIDENGF